MSRLRNRIRKADYFTDGELLRWPRDKRTTYSGMWALAEDSGCLEDDCFEWKMALWPSPLDADITVELLEQWRDEMIEAGKLIPYEADGRRYLYIRTFHQHEHPTNPQKPDLPVPEWVCAEVTEGRAKDGKKWSRCSITISTDAMPPRPGVCAESAQSQYRPESGVDSLHHAEDFRSPVLSCPVQTRPDQIEEQEPLAESASDSATDEAPLAGDIVSENDTGASFDAFWAAYPNKQGKLPAQRAWGRMSQRDRAAATDVATAMAYCVECGYRERSLCPYGSTFLHQRRWEEWRDEDDELRAPPGYGPPDTGPSVYERIDAVGRRIAAERGEEWHDHQ